MRRLLLSLFLALLFTVQAFAQGGSSTVIEIKDNKQYLIKTFELMLEDNLDKNIEADFELDGYNI